MRVDAGVMVTAEHHRETVSEIEERFRGLVAEHEKLRGKAANLIEALNISVGMIKTLRNAMESLFPPEPTTT